MGKVDLVLFFRRLLFFEHSSSFLGPLFPCPMIASVRGYFCLTFIWFNLMEEKGNRLHNFAEKVDD